MPVTAGFETGVSGNAIQVADAGNATAWDAVRRDGSSTINYSNAQAKAGSLAALFTANASHCHLRWQAAFGTQTDHYGRLYLYQTTRVQGNLIWTTDGAIAKNSSISQSATGEVTLNDDGGTGRATGTTQLPLNQWIRIEWHFVHSTTVGQLQCKLFVGANVDGLTADETITTAATINTDANAQGLAFGPYDAVGVAYFDAIEAANTTGYPGPAGTTTGREYKRLTGPAQLTGSAATLYTVPAGKRARIMNIHAANVSGSSADMTLSIGTDATGTRLYDGHPIAAHDVLYEHEVPFDLAAGEVLQGFASAVSSITLTVNGYEEPV